MERVLVDVDDTIAETQAFLIDRINAITGGAYTFESMTRGHRENAPEFKEWNENVWKLLQQPTDISQIEPSPKAAIAMAELKAQGYKPDIVTARKAPLFDCTDAWLKRHFFRPFVNEIHRRRNGESGVQFKVRVAREVGFAAAFEDTADVAEALASVIPVVYLIDKPWNREGDYPANVDRVPTFYDGVYRFLMD